MEQILSPRTSEVTLTCYNCENEVGLNALFCKTCGSQLKCKVCNSILEKGANFCIICGTKIISNFQVEIRAVNKIDYTQKGNSKSFTAQFTDEVGVYLAGAFNSVITGQPISKNPFQRTLGAPTKNQNFASSNIRDTSENIQDVEIVDNYPDIIAKVFKETETGKLEILDNRLKEKSKYDKMKRLSVLFAYAKKLMGNEFVSREELNEMMAAEKLMGSSFRKFLVREGTQYFASKENGNFSLLTAGEEYAREILSQIANPEFKPVTSKAGRKAGKKSLKYQSESSNGKESNSNSIKPSALEMCKILISENYFSQKRTLNDIVIFCEQKRATKYSSQNLQNALNRLVKDQLLAREKNKESQYEYWKK